MLLRPAFAALALSALCLTACKKHEEKADGAPTAAPVDTAPVKPAATPGPPTWDVPFRGKYSKTAKVTFRNGKRTRNESTSGIATMTIIPGKATYYVEYVSKGKTLRITQTYLFSQGDVRSVNGGYDVPMRFEKMEGDTKDWNPDSKDPKLEARKQGSAWEIGFLVRDTAGTQGGMEFR